MSPRRPLPRRAMLVALALTLVVPSAGCALTSKSRPPELRWFTPEPAASADARAGAGAGAGAAATSLTSAGGPTPRAAADAVHAPDAPRLRLGRVASSAHLRSRIVYRRSPHELGAYDNERWTESPEAYLRRALERALFDDGPLVRGVSVALPTLEVELVAFEEIRRDAATAGRVDVTYVLHDEREVLASGRVVVERPAASASMEDVVAAIGTALRDATTELSAEVAQRATRTPPPR